MGFAPLQRPLAVGQGENVLGANGGGRARL